MRPATSRVRTSRRSGKAQRRESVVFRGAYAGVVDFHEVVHGRVPVGPSRLPLARAGRLLAISSAQR